MQFVLLSLLFLQVVAGLGSGKVLLSGPLDHVFIYFADHGAQGIVAFPSDYLDGQRLNTELRWMAEHRSTIGRHWKDDIKTLAYQDYHHKI